MQMGGGGGGGGKSGDGQECSSITAPWLVSRPADRWEASGPKEGPGLANGR